MVIDSAVETEVSDGFRGTELGPLPVDWQTVRLADIVTKARQRDPRSEPSSTFRYVDVSAISREALRVDGFTEYEGKDAPSRARKVVATNDIIFATVRPYLKRVAMVPPDLDGEICSTAFCVIRCQDDVADPTFVFYAVTTDRLAERVTGHQRGSSYPAVTDKDVLSEVIPLPPLEEQRAIARVLSTIQRAIEATDKVIAATKELKRSLMRHLLTYGPVPVEEVEQVPLKETEIGLVPEHWEVVQLGDKCTLSTGTTPSTKEPDYWTGSIPFVKTSEIVNAPILSAQHHVSDKAVKDYGLKVHPAGTVFMAMYGQGKTRGQVGFLRVAAATSQNTAAITPTEHLTSPFLWQYLMSKYDALRASGAHGQVSHLNLGYLKEFKVLLPPPKQQEAIVAVLEGIQGKSASEEKRSGALKELFRTMLHLLMTGQVRVTSAEAANAEAEQ